MFLNKNVFSFCLLKEFFVIVFFMFSAHFPTYKTIVLCHSFDRQTEAWGGLAMEGLTYNWLEQRASGLKM